MKDYRSMGLEGILQEAYTVKISEYISSGWNTFKKNPVEFAGFTLVFFLINVAIARVSQSITLEGFISLFISAPLNAGFLIVAFKLLKNRATTFGDFFRGFNNYLPLLLVSLVSSLMIGIGLLLFLVPGIYLAVAYIFALPLVLERKMNFWVGMEFSRKLVSKNWLSFLSFSFVLLLLNLAGVLLLGVGLLVTIPVSACAIAAAYEDIVGLAPSSSDFEGGVSA
ncbi:MULTISPECIES: hypothetical protein [Cyanophyceae]|uniref:Glycerophosphoryl diester phosphodiesterase membrane domain-containing protein n=1 Tax=Leptolyngbya subtilissima DQ-A4 TaxID=2933933 RepID=A0ABV0KBX9_9CYAN|nr:hypothetical protein [Nodosilinea sp. FACHB-141]